MFFSGRRKKKKDYDNIEDVVKNRAEYIDGEVNQY